MVSKILLFLRTKRKNEVVINIKDYVLDIGIGFKVRRCAMACHQG